MAVPGMRHADVPAEVQETATTLLAKAIEVHRELGPGLRERDYRDCLVLELEEAGVAVEREVHVDLVYKGRRLERAARFDLVLNGLLLVELKAVETLHPHHWLQTRSYVRFGGFPLGILLNFHAGRLVDGWHRILPGRRPSAVTAATAPPRHRMKGGREDDPSGRSV